MPDPTIVFQVERDGSTLIILPQGPALQFSHQEVHLETNALYRLLDERDLRNVVVDLHCVDYVDSVIISSILRCLTKTKQKRGKAFFCNASENMTQLLKTIKIGKLWPSFDTREDAVAAVIADD
jgi:anti-anti-sigma factor